METFHDQVTRLGGDPEAIRKFWLARQKDLRQAQSAAVKADLAGKADAKGYESLMAQDGVFDTAGVNTALDMRQAGIDVNASRGSRGSIAVTLNDLNDDQMKTLMEYSSGSRTVSHTGGDLLAEQIKNRDTAGALGTIGVNRVEDASKGTDYFDFPGTTFDKAKDYEVRQAAYVDPSGRVINPGMAAEKTAAAPGKAVVNLEPPKAATGAPSPGRPKTSKIDDYLTGRRKGPISAIDEPSELNAGVGRRLQDLSSSKMPGAKQNRFIRETLENNGLFGSAGTSSGEGGAREGGLNWEDFKKWHENRKESYEAGRKEWWDKNDPSGRWTQEERDFEDSWFNNNKSDEEYEKFTAQRQARLKREYEEATNAARAEREAAQAAKATAQQERVAAAEARFAAETKAAEARMAAAVAKEEPLAMKAALNTERKIAGKELSHLHGRGGLVVGGLALLGIGAAAMSSQRKGRSRPTPDASIGTGHSSARSGLPVRSSATGIFGY